MSWLRVSLPRHLAATSHALTPSRICSSSQSATLIHAPCARTPLPASHPCITPAPFPSRCEIQPRCSVLLRPTRQWQLRQRRWCYCGRSQPLVWSPHHIVEDGRSYGGSPLDQPIPIKYSFFLNWHDLGRIWFLISAEPVEEPRALLQLDVASRLSLPLVVLVLNFCIS
jgi:hypothetical protein